MLDGPSEQSAIKSLNSDVLMHSISENEKLVRGDCGDFQKYFKAESMEVE